MVGGNNLSCDRVLAGQQLAHMPTNKASEYAPARAARASSCNVRDVTFNTKHLGQRRNCEKEIKKILYTRCSIFNYLPKQAYPAAEEASPAAVGKLFTEQMCTFQLAVIASPSLFALSLTA